MLNFGRKIYLIQIVALEFELLSLTAELTLLLLEKTNLLSKMLFQLNTFVYHAMQAVKVGFKSRLLSQFRSCLLALRSYRLFLSTLSRLLAILRAPR